MTDASRPDSGSPEPNDRPSPPTPRQLWFKIGTVAGLVVAAAGILALAAWPGEHLVYVAGCVVAGLLIFVAVLLLPGIASWHPAPRAVIAGVAAVACGFAAIQAPAILLRSQLTQPTWQTRTAEPQPQLLAAPGRLWVFDKYSLTAYEPGTGRQLASIPNRVENPIRSVVVGEDGSVATYRAESDSSEDGDRATISYYAPAGHRRWTIDAGPDSSATTPVWAIADGYVVVHNWTEDGNHNLLRAIGPHGHEVWRHATPDSSYSVPAASPGQQYPGAWWDARIHLAPTVAVFAGSDPGPITVRTMQGRTIDSARGELLGVRSATVVLRDPDGRVEARRNGQRLWRGGQLPAVDSDMRVAFSPHWLHVEQGDTRHTISLEDGTVRAVGADVVDDPVTDLLISRAGRKYRAADPRTGGSRWTYQLAKGAKDCDAVGGGPQALVIECRVGNLPRLAGHPEEGYQIDVLDTETGQRTARIIRDPTKNETFGLSYDPISAGASTGPGRAAIAMLTGELINVG